MYAIYRVNDEKWFSGWKDSVPVFGEWAEVYIYTDRQEVNDDLASLQDDFHFAVIIENVSR